MAKIDNNEFKASSQDEKNVPDSGLQILARMIARNIISKRAIILKKENVTPSRASK